jgi:hypothetical protein
LIPLLTSGMADDPDHRTAGQEHRGGYECAPARRPGVRYGLLRRRRRQGSSLHDLGIAEFDPSYGGRWNAGSNERRGGTTLSPDEYREDLVRVLREKV